MNASFLQNTLCYCNSGKHYSDCCEPYITAREPAPTAETLMRSRYSAYVLNKEDYLLATWHTSTRPDNLGLLQQSAAKWIGLKIVATNAGGKHDDTGTVEFIARYKTNGKATRLHEVSRFVKEKGKWYYVDGNIKE